MVLQKKHYFTFDSPTFKLQYIDRKSLFYFLLKLDYNFIHTLYGQKSVDT